MSTHPVVVVGAGLAGLSCARHLHAAGLPTLVLEAAEEVGGRVQTDRLDGFLLDRGFQVLQTAYPEAKSNLDYGSLDLRPFDPGALIRTERGWASMLDPWRRPTAALETVFNEVGTLADRWRLAKLRWSVVAEKGSDKDDMATIDFLQKECRFSKDFIERFLRPWISGMFFDESLETSAKFFQFVFRMLATGEAALPNEGMGAIAKQLAASLPADTVQCSRPVAKVHASEITCADGESIATDAVVLAVPVQVAAQWTDAPLAVPKYGSTTCFYFAAEKAPEIGKTLALNGQNSGPINNVCIPSEVASGYAPSGASLICVSTREVQSSEVDLEAHVRVQLSDWFGSQVSKWRTLRRYEIAQAIPRQLPGSFDRDQPSKLRDGVYICGDFRQSASIQGAMESGRLAAQAVLRDLS